MIDKYGDEIINIENLKSINRLQSNEFYRAVLKDNDTKCIRSLAKYDLFFLLSVILNRTDMNKDWIYDRCREVQAEPDGMIDLWAREHYKSTIITFGLSIQTVLVNPNETIGIFSHTKGIAKGFLDQIKSELEKNTLLKDLFPDILYQEPQKQSDSWSLDRGLTLKRDQNPKEKTFEAWGLVDGQPTSKHFSVMVYDDVVSLESVSTPEQMKKTTTAWEISTNLGADNGKVRYIGTRYHQSDTWGVIISRKSAKPRIHAATDNGKLDGNPVFLTREKLEKKRNDQGSYTFSCQMLQNPLSDNAMKLDKEWLKFYEKIEYEDTKNWNRYIFVDPANEKKKTNDYTVMAVIGLAPDKNYYLLDAIRDRLNLSERTTQLFDYVKKWNPNAVFYEKYGKDSDDQHIKEKMETENYRFNLLTIGGSTPKYNRIFRLQPICEQGRFYLPKKLFFIARDGKVVDFVEKFIEDEYDAFPTPIHDDMLDCIARVLDPQANIKFPMLENMNRKKFTPKPIRNKW